jgi:hypothetical protein
MENLDAEAHINIARETIIEIWFHEGCPQFLDERKTAKL